MGNYKLNRELQEKLEAYSQDHSVNPEIKATELLIKTSEAQLARTPAEAKWRPKQVKDLEKLKASLEKLKKAQAAHDKPRKSK